ncbi:MAG: hypothetical protein C4345_07110, partial [Chloroflexota bacterium]
MGGDAYLAAHLQHRAYRAARQCAGTDVLSEGDEQAVDLQPVLAWERALELSHGLLRRARLHIAPAVGHPMNVDIELDRRIMTVRDILELQPGSVIKMSRSAGENIDVLVGGTL